MTDLMSIEEAVAKFPGIGRRKLMKLTGRTAYACERYLKGEPVPLSAVPLAVKSLLAKPCNKPAGLACETIKGGLGEFAGLQGFAALHAPESRQRRHDEATKALVEKFIGGPLKQRGWYYDQEAARVAGVGSQDWARFRDAYSHLLVSVRTDAGSRNEKICWCHPDCVEDMRAIAEGRKLP